MILIAEDNPIDREFLASALRTLGYPYIAADDGHSAIALLPEHGDKLSAAILDLDMPGIDGISLLGHLRIHYANLPVIILTGLDDEEYETICMNWQAVAYLRKPLNPKVLAEKLQNVLSVEIPTRRVN